MSSRRPAAIVIDRSRTRSWMRPDGRSILSEHAVDTVVVTDRPPGENHPRPADPSVSHHLVEQLDLRTLLGVAERYAGRLLGISTTSELFLHVAADLRQALGLPGKSPDYVHRVRDKWAMKQTGRAGGVPITEGYLASDIDVHGLPASLARSFMKPRSMSGARGAREIHEADDLSRQLEALGSEASGYLVEEFMDHPLFHLDGIVSEGTLDVLLSAYTRPPHTAGGRSPLGSWTQSEGPLTARAHQFMADVVRAWGLEDDVFHCEAFWTGDEFVLCEVAGRPGGAGVSEAYGIVRGTDLRWAKTFLDLGLPLGMLPSPPLRSCPAAGWLVMYEAPARDPDFAHFTGHLAADIRSRAEVRVRGHSGVGNATFIFGAGESSAVRTLMASYESLLGDQES